MDTFAGRRAYAAGDREQTARRAGNPVAGPGLPGATATRMWLTARTLDGLGFPAWHWQLVAQAELNGVDGVTHERLRCLPVRIYESCADVVSELVGPDRQGHRRPV